MKYLKLFCIGSIPVLLIYILFLYKVWNTAGGDIVLTFLIVAIPIVSVILFGIILLFNFSTNWKKEKEILAIFSGIIIACIINYVIMIGVYSYRSNEFHKKHPYYSSPYENQDSTTFRMTYEAPDQIPLELINKEKVEEIWYESDNLVNLPDAFIEIKNLKKIRFHNVIKLDLQQAFSVLSNLNIEDLTITNSNIRYLPNNILDLKYLEQLDLSANDNLDLDSLFSQLQYLPKLKRIDLRMLHIRSFPSSIKKLQSLKILVIPYGDIETLPSTLMEMDSLEWVILKSNPVAKNWWNYIDSTKIQFRVSD